MKILVGFSRIFVAGLFLFSGFIKLNDPIGFSYKLSEYFGEGVLNLEFLIPFSLLIAVFLVIFEVIVGITLLLGYLPKFTVWSLLLMIGFFTFLTFYSAYFNKVTDCGCFGDALPLTPWESFTKDVILSVFIIVLFFGRKYITPILPVDSHKWIVFVCFTFCLGFAYYVLMHLPVFDFRAYKIGTNIQEGMSVPEDAPEAAFEYNWKFDVNGKEKVVTTSGDYPIIEGTFIDVTTEMIEEGYIPPIHDFAIEKDGVDVTTKFLEKENLILIIQYNLAKSELEGMGAIKTLADRAMAQGYDVIGLTASLAKDMSEMKERFDLNFDYYNTDETALKTILRSNPGIVQLKRGTIVEKLHYNDADKLLLEKVAPSKPKVNTKLKFQLDSIIKLDQAGRSVGDISRGEQKIVDSTNTLFIEKVFKEYGYPGKTLVGEETSQVAWSVIQHSGKIGAYLPLIKEAGEQGELPSTSVAMMEDRYLVHQNQEQIYGTQVKRIHLNKKDTIAFIWPIKNADSVNIRRVKVGFEETVEEYCQRILGIDYKKYSLDEAEKLVPKTSKQ